MEFSYAAAHVKQKYVDTQPNGLPPDDSSPMTELPLGEQRYWTDWEDRLRSGNSTPLKDNLSIKMDVHLAGQPWAFQVGKLSFTAKPGEAIILLNISNYPYVPVTNYNTKLDLGVHYKVRSHGTRYGYRSSGTWVQFRKG